MTDEAMSPLRRRMIEDMTIRKSAAKTQHDCVQRVNNFASFLGRSPDTASFEDVRRYQLHLAASGAGVPTLNQSVATLRFFFRVTLKRYDIVEHTHCIHEPHYLDGVPPVAEPMVVGFSTPKEKSLISKGGFLGGVLASPPATALSSSSVSSRISVLNVVFMILLRWLGFRIGCPCCR